MRNIRKNITSFFYLVFVLGLGLASIFTGRIVADRQKKIIPPETKAYEEACLIKCRCEVGSYGSVVMCQSACNLKDVRVCEPLNDNCGNEERCVDCWAPVCAPPPPPPTATPTPIPTSTPIPTPTPLPGCWGVCTVDTNCPQNTTPPLVCPGGRCVNPNCPTEQDCTCPPLLCLGLTATPSADLLKGSEIELTCKGGSGADQPINHVEFQAQIDGGAWTNLGTSSLVATTPDGMSTGTKKYIVPQTGNHRIECRVCTSTDASACTNWGLAQ